MCDIIPGRLIVSLPSGGAAATRLPGALELQAAIGSMNGVRYLESLEKKLSIQGLKPRSGVKRSLHLLDVRPGEESRVTGLLYDWYGALVLPRFAPGDGLLVGPNYVMTISGSELGAATPSGQNFAFGPDYAMYQTMTGLPAAKPVNPLRVLLADTGIAPDATISIHSSKNLLDVGNSSVDDDNGHGTAVALVVDNLAPSNEFVIYKVGDANGRMNEWDLLAALLADSGAHVINLSVEYGLKLRNCSSCGRQSASSRSAVFENILNGTALWKPQPTIVAAAGNSSDTELAYPARFANVVAAGAVNSSKRKAQESNTGDRDHEGNAHDNHFAAPGGDSASGATEHVIELSDGTKYRGTSFAAAFMSAAVVAERAKQASANCSAILTTLRNNADDGFSGYSTTQHGHGIVQV